MVSRMLRWFPGWVRVQTEGGYPERLLNDLAAAGVEVWHIRRHNEGMRFSCRAGDYRYIRPMARRACLRMRLQHKHGFPFWRHRYRYRRGLLVGLALYAVILGVLSSRVWVVEVEGNALTPTAAILEQAEQYGVRLGARVDRLDIKGFQLHGPDALSTVAYITVNPSHCVARIQVTERDPTPQIVDLSRPSDLVAARDGRILQIDSRSGKPLVRVGEAVTAGTVLITGCVETDLGRNCTAPTARYGRKPGVVSPCRCRWYKPNRFYRIRWCAALLFPFFAGLFRCIVKHLYRAKQPIFPRLTP